MATTLDRSAHPESAPHDSATRRGAAPLSLRRRINRVLPRSLLGRSVMILVTPLILLQVVATWVFYDSFWDKITRRLAGAVAGDIAAVVDLMEGVPAGSDLGPLFDMAARRWTSVRLATGAQLPTDTMCGADLVDLKLAEELGRRVGRPCDRSRSIEIRRDPCGCGRRSDRDVPRLRLFSSTTYVFILWMVSTSVGLFGRDLFIEQIGRSPPRRRHHAFGKGRPVELRPKCAEVHRPVPPSCACANASAGRWRSAEILAGVSHDLRTRAHAARIAMSPQTGLTADSGRHRQMKKMLKRLPRL
jgi:two-component system osmolarity sensor histidine kinase EnvZ